MPDQRIHKGVIVHEGRFPTMLAAAESKHKASNSELPEIVTPDGTSGPAEWGRYHDAVREASRSFDNPDVGDVHHFLNARARHPEKVDVEKFHEAVRRQRMADIVDISDHHMRRDGSLPRGSRMVRVQAPRGYLRRALRQSSAEDLAHLHHRLVSIGHNSDHVSKFLSERVSPDIWDQASTVQVTMSDDEFGGLSFDDSESESLEMIEAITEMFNKMPPPVVNVYISREGEITSEPQS
jgi:hypothetical protein